MSCLVSCCFLFLKNWWKARESNPMTCSSQVYTLAGCCITGLPAFLNITGEIGRLRTSKGGILPCPVLDPRVRALPICLRSHMYYILIRNVSQHLLNLLAGLERIELPPSVSKTEMISISPKTELYGAANRVRTGDIHVGNVMLYQLSYSRIFIL